MYIKNIKIIWVTEELIQGQNITRLVHGDGCMIIWIKNSTPPFLKAKYKRFSAYNIYRPRVSNKCTGDHRPTTVSK